MATKKKLYIGKVTNHFPNLGVGEFVMETGSLNLNDEILITGPTTGALQLNVEELRYDLEPVDKVIKGQRFSMPVPEKVRRNDKLFKMIDAKAQ
jgi:putative protease